MGYAYRIQPRNEVKMIKLYRGDCLEVMREIPDKYVQCCVTSPPYWGLRDYGNDAQLGLEKTPEEYVNNMVEVFREVKRILKKDGTLWLNLGDSYAGSGKGRNADGSHQEGGKQGTSRGTIEGKLTKMETVNLKPKDLVGIPWRVAFALQADGWYLRQDIIWAKPNPMPESVKDRCTKSHEYIFLMSKNKKYYYDIDAIKEPSVYPNDNRKARQNVETYNHMNSNIGQIKAVINPKNAKIYPKRNKRSVWTVATKPFKAAHFATFPPKLIEPCILAGCPKGGTVFDPFSGAGTTGVVAIENNREFIGIELNQEYIEIAKKRIKQAEKDKRYTLFPDE